MRENYDPYSIHETVLFAPYYTCNKSRPLKSGFTFLGRSEHSDAPACSDQESKLTLFRAAAVFMRYLGRRTIGE